MKTQTDMHPAAVETKTIVVAKTVRRVPRPAPTDRTATATPAAHEQEADHWVAQMMFENYNP